ncbi:ricin-type beta-trefoil lectin domain protein [Actinoplanes sp. NPDC024001]|uniref:RICIN domain-containing protein n=1 Tax=Actinoplanes sp. NPDC024001 TaxID=3154598 RepID=UPI0033E90D9A
MRDERGSLPLALLVAAAGLAISGLLSSALLSQVKDVRRVAERGQALGGAEAGLQVALGYIRAAADSDGNGRLASLPCGTLQGTVSGAPGNGYRVTVTYHNAGGGEMKVCPPTQTPATARLESADVTDGSAGGTGRASTVSPRVLEANYDFRTPRPQIRRGLIHSYPSGELCMDAGDQPKAGTVVHMRTCDQSRPHRQMFAYVKNMAVVHPAPAFSTDPDLCLEASATATIVLQPCAVAPDDTTTPSPARQLWTFSRNFAGFIGTDDGKTVNNLCVTLKDTSGAETPLTYAACPKTYASSATMQPDYGVGAGAAGESTEQLVNYEQLGRCLDVTEGNVKYGSLIVWPCTADPQPANISWNQRWTLPTVSNLETGGTGQVTVTYTDKNKVATKYCLTSPRSAETGRFAAVAVCSSAKAEDITWTRYRAHDAKNKSYTLVDSAGLCLASSTKQLYTRVGDKIGKAVVAECDGSDLQKWNAVVADETALTDIQER